MKKKVLLMTLASLLFFTGIATGATYERNIKAYFYGIKIFVDGKMITTDKEPFIYENSTYVPLRVVTEALGGSIKWNPESNSIAITKGNGTVVSGNTVFVPKETANYSLSDVRSRTERNFEKYTRGEKDLKFRIFLEDKSNSVEVELRGDFEKNSTYWSKRNDSKFDSYVEDIARFLSDETKKDIKITVFDTDKKEVGKYDYDKSRNKFSGKAESGSSSGDTSKLEKDLNSDFSRFKDNGDYDRLDFDKVTVKEKRGTVTVTLKGDFKGSDKSWKNKETRNFEKWIEKIGSKVSKDMDSDSQIIVEDSKGDELVKYEYSSKKEKITDTSESKSSSSRDDDDSSASDIEKKLKKSYSEYTRGSSGDLEFSYSVKIKSDEVRITMSGKNFSKKDSAWEDRKDSKFTSFVSDLCADVSKLKKKTDISITIEDEKGKSLESYTYDYKKEKLK